MRSAASSVAWSGADHAPRHREVFLAVELAGSDSTTGAGFGAPSRTLSAEIVAAQVAQHPGIEVTYHDLANEPVMHLSPAHLAAFQGGRVESAALGQDLAQGARYLDELIAADVLVIGAPMYNHSVPSQLKAWIDRVVVAGKTFRYKCLRL
jgi:FMN-dependent NADH-azoreductase